MKEEERKQRIYLHCTQAMYSFSQMTNYLFILFVNTDKIMKKTK